MAVEIERLVVEEGQHGGTQALAFEFQRGLTVAFHENPAVRARFIADLVEALGPGRAGLHLELIDSENHRLAVFRPYGDRHRVVDIDRIADLTEQYAAPGDRVDILGRMGLDPAAALRAVRIGPQELERGLEADGETMRLIRALGGVDQAQLWAAAEAVETADARLAAAFDAVGGASIEQIQAVGRVVDARRDTEWAEHEHRRISRLGYGITGACALIGGVLLAADSVLEDNGFTGWALIVLSVVALALSVLDRRHVQKARRIEADLRAQSGIVPAEGTSEEAFWVAAGPLADDAARRAVLDADAQHREALDHWSTLSSGASVAWARQHRAGIDRMAERRHRLAELHSSGVLGSESETAEAARLLIDKVIELQSVGVARERLPLLLDEPFVGMPVAEVGRLLETMVRLSQDQQVVLVTGDTDIQSWATGAQARGVGLSRIGRPSSVGAPTDTGATASLAR